MNSMFQHTEFNQPINTSADDGMPSNVKDMAYMFKGNISIKILVIGTQAKLLLCKVCFNKQHLINQSTQMVISGM